MDQSNMGPELWERQHNCRPPHSPDTWNLEKSGVISITEEEYREFRDKGKIPKRIQDLWEIDSSSFSQMIECKEIRVI